MWFNEIMILILMDKCPMNNGQYMGLIACTNETRFKHWRCKPLRLPKADCLG